MNIKNVIICFEKYEINLATKISVLKGLFSEGKLLWQEFGKLGENFFLNDKVMNFLADSLQNVNDEELLQSFDLNDIKQIYELLVVHYPYNIQYHEDLISFVYHVLGQEEEALLLTQKAQQMLAVKGNSLMELINKVKNSH